MRLRIPRLPRTIHRSHLLAAGAIAIALGGIVIARANGAFGSGATPRDRGRGVAHATNGQRINFAGPGLDGFAALTQGAVLANGSRQVFAELRLTGREDGRARERAPVALAVVLDTSGSMMGQKIEDARRSVAELVSRMRDEDQIAVVLYNSTTSVLQPLARVGAVRSELIARIHGVQATGGTMIPDALAEGSRALAEAGPRHVRRVVLVSDGLDGSGQTRDSIAAQVRSRSQGGIGTSTLGIGTDYDEAFMTAVADAGRGNYAFLANGEQLRAFLGRELDQASSTVADQVVASLELPAGWSLVRVVGAEASRSAQSAELPIGTLYAGERRKLVLELAVTAGSAGNAGAAGVALAWRSTADSARHDGRGHLSLRAVDDEAAVVASRDVELHADALATFTDLRQTEAITAWREGRREDAIRLGDGNLQALREQQRIAPTPSAAAAIRDLEQDMANFRNHGADSAEGRAGGLGSNAARRARVQSF
ncbi:MAG: VWA domain-containing protein [Deltaproteobacteria bacterium]|nr:VWA domain-containing protein [Deltaproteobacteria bacterium]